MKIEIWSDVLCPFCYIGKRNFEQALKQFAHKDKVEVVWRSYQLDPEVQHIPGRSVHDYLSERKGMSRQQAKQLNDQVTAMAKEAGLEYNLDQAVVANTFDAHRLTHVAAEYGLQNEAEERLFSAYFTEGKNIGDPDTLVRLGSDIGLNPDVVKKTLHSDAYGNEVRSDQLRAQQTGIRGVPFFVFNNKYAVSGARPSEVFAGVLSQVWDEEHPADQNAEGAVCTPEGVCR